MDPPVRRTHGPVRGTDGPFKLSKMVLIASIPLTALIVRARADLLT